jgi:hypothetical protein
MHPESGVRLARLKGVVWHAPRSSGPSSPRWADLRAAGSRKSGPAVEVYPNPSAVQKNMLHQKLTAKEHELRQALDKLRAADRQIKGTAVCPGFRVKP